MAKVIESNSVERAYGFRGTEAIVEHNGKRMLVTDGFGGIDSLRGGAVRWDHGIVVELQPDDTLESLKSEQWNEMTTVFEAVVHGYDDRRPLLADANPSTIAKAAGLQ